MKIQSLLILITFFSIPNLNLAQVPDTLSFATTTYQVSMRDNVTLATNVLSPKENKHSFPVIFLRTPYGKEYECKMRAHYTNQGYIVVVQDCRGTGGSKGTFEPYLHEKEDGYDALDWISKQSWCNGNVGMIGASYEGQVQWLAAASGHSVLKTIIPQVAGTDPFLDVPYDHGILKLSMIEWAYKLSFPERKPPEYILDKLYTLPVSKIDDEFFGIDIPLWNSWIKMDNPSDWIKARFLDDMKDVNIPVLNVSGNWDVEALSTQTNWLKMQSYNKTNQHLLFGPWEHTNFLNALPTKFSGIEYGEKSKLDFESIWLRWFDHWLKGIDNGIEKERNVQFFVTGLNTWLSMEKWPDKTFKQREYFFNFSVSENGFYKLDNKITLGQTEGYDYFPDKARMNEDPEFSESSYYIRDINAKDDIALISDPFLKDEILGGPTVLKIKFSIDQSDVDLFVIIAEVDSSGNISVLSHPGKMRATFMDNKNITPIEPGKYYNATIDLFPIAHQFKKGSKLAVIIRSDWFPRYIRNPGTTDPLSNNSTIRNVKVKISSETRLVMNTIE